MIEITEKKVKLWNSIGMRAAFGLMVHEIAGNLDDLMVITADVATSAGLNRFKKDFPDKFIDVGIAEQNMIGVAAGLASEGYKVITTTFAPFQTMRCLEQIRVNLGYGKQKVIMVGLGAGLALGPLGYTHCCIEDIGVLRSIPNIAIVVPADCRELAKALIAAIEYPDSVYIRFTGDRKLESVYGEDYDFIISRSIPIIYPSYFDIAMFVSGSIISECKIAWEILLKEGWSPAIFNVPTIKPFLVNDGWCMNKSIIVTVEEHNIIGGLGSAIAERLSLFNEMPSLLRIGAKDRYGVSGEYNDLLKDHGLTGEQIARRICQEISL